jgi:hypothetical protein
MTSSDNKLYAELLDDIKAIVNDERLYQEKNFNLRAQAIDDIEFHIIDRVGGINELTTLKQYVEKVKHDLEDVDVKMFQQIRAKISTGELRERLLLNQISEYFDNDLDSFLQQDVPGYDNLDVFFNGLLTDQNLPTETKVREPEMVFNQKTPARIILELIKRADFKSTDVFFDIGSGLGQISILVNLLTGVTAKGIEFEPAFCSYANDCAAGLNLTKVKFIYADARYADYSTGTVFFMYTPFEGKMLQDVLQKLSREAEKRMIKLFTYGPCTVEVGKRGWLVSKSENTSVEFGEFVSVLTA